MKVFFLVAFLWLTLGCSGKPVRDDSGLTSVDEFKEDLASINFELSGSLSRYHYNGDLSRLTYERYVGHLEGLNRDRASRLLRAMAGADDHFFHSQKRTFFVCFESKRDVYVLCDDAFTSTLDRITRSKPLPKMEDLLFEVQKKPL